MLQARPAAGAGGAPSGEPQNVVLNVDGAPFKGEKTAKLTLIEFSDFLDRGSFEPQDMAELVR